jgi:hypothetical protein
MGDTTDSDDEFTSGRAEIRQSPACKMSSCRPLTGWRHPDAEALYHAILASPTNIDIFTRMDRDTSVGAGFFAGITSELRIQRGQPLGILLKMHSSLLIEVLPTPVGIIVNKNNTAPCGTGTNLAIHNSSITPPVPSAEIANELERGFTHCYTLQHYIEEILVDPKYRFNRTTNQLIFVGDGTQPPIVVDLREFNGSCTTITNITHLLCKSYETISRDYSFIPECYLSFHGITFDLLHPDGLAIFLRTFRVTIHDPIFHQPMLENVFEQIRAGRMLTNHLITLIEFFRDVFGATVVNMFDSGCTSIYDSTQSRYLTPAEGHHAMSQLKYKGVFFDGYGGKRKTKRKKSRKKRKQKTKNKNI